MSVLSAADSRKTKAGSRRGSRASDRQLGRALGRNGGKRTYKAAAERREQILDCALEAFAERGYHATSIADICERAHIGRGTLYQYFDDKRGVLVALAERIASRITKQVQERPRLEIPPGFRPTEREAVAFMEQRLVDSLGVVFADAATARVLLTAGRGADGVVDEILQRVDEVVLGVMEAELRSAVAAGIVRPLDETLVARFLLGGIEKLVLAHLDRDRPIDLRAIAREAALLEARGILASPPSVS